MNYEELLDKRYGKATKVGDVLTGTIFKLQVNKKYTNVLVFRKELFDEVLFKPDMGYEEKLCGSLDHRNLLHYKLYTEEKTGIPRLLIEQGNFWTIADLLREKPAIVASKGMLDTLVDDILNVTEYLHEHQIRHVCYSPETVLCRRGDNRPMLMAHGSFYLNCREQVFARHADWLAPEVLSGGEVDDRTDIYGIGKLMEYLFSLSDIPLQYRRAIEKATQQDPDLRYQSIAEMRSAIKTGARLRRTAFIAAAVAVLLAVGAFVWYEAVGSSADIEYISGVKETTPEENFLDEGINLETELGPIHVPDSVTELSDEEKKKQKEYRDKAEAIFRRQFTAEANKAIDRVYNNATMSNNSAHNFQLHTQQAIAELMKLQEELAKTANVSEEKSQMIATEIIDKITAEKMKKLQKSDEEE